MRGDLRAPARPSLLAARVQVVYAVPLQALAPAKSGRARRCSGPQGRPHGLERGGHGRDLIVTIGLSLGELEPESATPKRRDDQASDDVGPYRGNRRSMILTDLFLGRDASKFEIFVWVSSAAFDLGCGLLAHGARWRSFTFFRVFRFSVALGIVRLLSSASYRARGE